MQQALHCIRNAMHAPAPMATLLSSVPYAAPCRARLRSAAFPLVMACPMLWLATTTSASAHLVARSNLVKSTPKPPDSTTPAVQSPAGPLPCNQKGGRR
jgi:hypothetical protein